MVAAAKTDSKSAVSLLCGGDYVTVSASSPLEQDAVVLETKHIWRQWQSLDMSGGIDQTPAPKDKDGVAGVKHDHYLGGSAAQEEQGSRGIYYLSSFDRIFASSVRNAVTQSKIAPSVESSIHQH